MCFPGNYSHNLEAVAYLGVNHKYSFLYNISNFPLRFTVQNTIYTACEILERQSINSSEFQNAVCISVASTASLERQEPWNSGVVKIVLAERIWWRSEGGTEPRQMDIVTAHGRRQRTF